MNSRDLTFVLGGARSGKSAYAERLAASNARPVTYIATARIAADDDEFAQRVEQHRARRPEHWQLIEADADLAGALRGADGDDRCILIDCLTLWLAGLICPPDGAALSGDACAARLNAFEAALAEARGKVIVVSNEIGLGVVPLGAQTRHYVDELGRLNQRIAALSTQVTLMVAGLPMIVKPSSAPK
ncbi:bifunctional adenosylcobinamide kinase/adenosylcobinamide-phosphate guanylyltransferase [Trinickia mobilis]|uniref:bifunctional adenosylcobinamide kinase/adenosylcobinamide-phosphate guanylyltransferase n=1 Tax=Trinickia mobilis TaxID=2816356 RepID=UPI001A8E0D3C|nr:bifunctional adenosylcobinamide kinase/adenosylcobinamide-phosphate guanylyltransferase [Trinickia mobilis]